MIITAVILLQWNRNPNVLLFLCIWPLPLYSSSGWAHFVQRLKICSVQVGLRSTCLNFWLNEKCKETGWLKNEHAILFQVQCIHTASLLWHTHQAEWHPTHQLSSHVKFTQCADRQKNSLVCCVHICFCIYVCVHMRQKVCVCSCLYCMPMFCEKMCTVSLRMSRMDVMDVRTSYTQYERENQ